MDGSVTIPDSIGQCSQIDAIYIVPEDFIIVFNDSAYISIIFFTYITPLKFVTNIMKLEETFIQLVL